MRILLKKKAAAEPKRQGKTLIHQGPGLITVWIFFNIR
jgi:hypothetical protein